MEQQKIKTWFEMCQTIGPYAPDEESRLSARMVSNLTKKFASSTVIAIKKLQPEAQA